MVARDFVIKEVHWLAILLCIFTIGSASTSLSYESANTIYSEHAEIIGLVMTDFAGSPSFGPSAARSEKVECLTSTQSRRPAPPNVTGEVIASWYGPKHHDKLTTSGQRFNMYKNTLAHRTLPMGTKVLLINPDNGKSAQGIVNDRGPFIKGRDVDVSYAIAKQLGFIKKGVIKLNIETI